MVRLMMNKMEEKIMARVKMSKMELTLGKVRKSLFLSPSSHSSGLKEEERVNVPSAGRLASRSKLVSLLLASKSIVLIGSDPL